MGQARLLNGITLCWLGNGGVAPMPIIIIGGSPGSGKSTLASNLRSRLNAPWVDFGRLREFHLKPDWSDQGPAEESLAFENLLFIVRNYFRHGYANVLVDDLKDIRVRQIPAVLTDVPFRILTLVVGTDQELRERIVKRNAGWKHVDGAVEWNRSVISRPTVAGEYKIDTASKSPSHVVDEAIRILHAVSPA